MLLKYGVLQSHTCILISPPQECVEVKFYLARYLYCEYIINIKNVVICFLRPR